jgi:NTP pyrophosphatase (non-canonical NTP hydrolase)
MRLTEYQKEISKKFDKISKNFDNPTTAEFAFYKITEELGEVAEEFRRWKFHKKRNEQKMFDEIVDLFNCVLWFASKVGLNVEKMEKQIEKNRRKLKRKFGV